MLGDEEEREWSVRDYLSKERRIIWIVLWDPRLFLQKLDVFCQEIKMHLFKVCHLIAFALVEEIGNGNRNPPCFGDMVY